MDARLLGQADYRNGKKLQHNPYRSIRLGKRAWIKGWHEAREAEELFASGTLTEGGDAKQAQGRSPASAARSEAQGDAP